MASMYVSQLDVDNVRGFRKRTFEFKPGFNLIVGENGAGKSTLLRALAAVLAVPRLRPAPPGLSNDDISLGEQRLHLTATIKAENAPDSRELTYSRRIGAGLKRPRKNQIFPVLWYGANEARTRSFPIGRTRWSRTSDPRLGEETTEAWLYSETRPIIQSASDSQRFGRSEVISEFLTRALASFSDTFSAFDWVFEPSNCKIQFRTKNSVATETWDGLGTRFEQAILHHLRSSWNAALSAIDRRSVRISSKGILLDDGKGVQVIPPFFELLRGYPKLPAKIEELEVEIRLAPRVRITTNSGSRFLLSQLSDGEQRLFSIFVDIARQLSLRPAFENFSHAQALILIDEIDVHLHPKWQRRIVPKLEDLFPSCQFVATTHSPFVVQATREDNVQHLDRHLMGQFADRGIEEIAVKVMDVVDPEVSPRYFEMLDAAKEYFQTLEETRLAGDANGPEQFNQLLEPLKARLDWLGRKYAWNPAYQAYLELMTESRLGSIQQS